MKKIIAVFFIVAAFVLFSWCTKKPSIFEYNDNVVLVADENLWSEVSAEIKAAIEKEMHTPLVEKVFTIIRIDPSEVETVTPYPHVVFVGTLASTGITEEILMQLLDDSARDKVMQDQAFIFQKQDAWSENQLLLVLAGKDAETLEANIEQNQDFIFQYLDDHADKVAYENVYRGYSQEDLTKKLMDKHGWTVRVQHDYFAAIDSADAQFVWLRRFEPQRNLFVHWQTTDDSTMLSKEWMAQTRDSLTQLYYKGDYILQSDEIPLKDKVVEFQGRQAIRVDGVWQNDEYVVGGPFRSYGFYDDLNNKLYLIDLSVFAPDALKWPYMRQIDVMAKTFRIQQQ